MKFTRYEEMYAKMQACHNSKGDHIAVFNEFAQLEEDEAFGIWDMDFYQCGAGNMFCCEITHYNHVDNKTYVFHFYSDNSDTVADDKVYSEFDELIDSKIDYTFLNIIATQ